MGLLGNHRANPCIERSGRVPMNPDKLRSQTPCRRPGNEVRHQPIPLRLASVSVVTPFVHIAILSLSNLLS